MKKLIFAMFALAMTATTFVSCEDVPAPYALPTDGGDDSGEDKPAAEAKGSGTLEDPYNCVAANNVAAALTQGTETDADVYVKGIVVSVKEEYTTNYGNATYYISEDGTETNQFYVYRALYLGNKKFATGNTQIKAGDEVIICGHITNYSGTYETAQNKAYLYSLNGKTADGGSTTTGEATGDGSLENPYNYIAATNLANSLDANDKTENVYIKGKVSEIKEEYSTQYGNGTFYLSDDGTTSNQFYVYRALYLENKKFAEGNTQIKVGDDVIVYGQITKFVSSYGTTLETAQGAAYLYSLNGKTIAETGSSTGGEDKPATTTGLITNGDFETWEGSTPTGWKSSSSASNATLSQSTDAHGGEHSVSVGYSASSNKRLAYKEITLKPGTYTFSFYAKATTSDASQCRPGYAIVVNGKIDSSSGYKYGSYATISNSEWTLVSHEFTLDAETTICLLVMNPKTSTYATAQNILVDDASLTTKNGGLVE